MLAAVVRRAASAPGDRAAVASATKLAAALATSAPANRESIRIKLITRQSLAAKAAERWKKQYRTPKIHRKLLALGPNPPPDTVDEIIGNSAWTQVPDCSECQKTQNDCVVEVGEEPWYESVTAYLCRECVLKAAELISF